MLCSSAAFADETKNGTAAQTNRDTEVRKQPSEDAESFGILPTGTVLTLRGQRDGDFLAVKVELEDGNIEGWVNREAISRESMDDSEEDRKPRKKRRRRDDDEEDMPTERRSRLRPRSRMRIPKDEGLLLRRDATFFFGLQAGGGVAIMQDQSSAMYVGPSLSAGGHIGFYLARNIPLRIMVNYSLLTGSASADSGTGTGGTGGTGGSGGSSSSNVAITNSGSVSFGFLDAVAELQYNVEHFQVLGFAQYSYGLSLSDLPTALASSIGSAKDLSSAWFGAGLGYLIPVSEVLDISLRARYGISLTRDPIGFQNISLGIAVEFKG